MKLQIKVLVCVVVTAAALCLWPSYRYPARLWVHFWVYLVAVLLSSGMKIALPKANGTMSVNFPFILLGILQLSPLQAAMLAACSVIAQCNFRVVKAFTLIQISFNIANVITATIFAWYGYVLLLRYHCEGAPALAIAATVYFFTNTIPVATIIALSCDISPVKQWREHFPWYLPFYLVGAMLAFAVDRIGITFGWSTSLLMIPLMYIIYRAYTAQQAMLRAREQQAIETQELHLRTIEALAMAIEAKDKGTHDHLLRVKVYVSEIGRKMKLEDGLIQALVTAAFLHDIGKLAVPEHIINKPGKLTREEFEKMKIHPSVGADILERVRFPYPVVPIVRSHHESWDGSGYPDGLQGTDIPIGARILSVVDCFDAMASERPYRKAMPLEVAMAQVKSRSGIQFDPEIVAILEDCYLAMEELARKGIEQMKPLDTEVLISRGDAPGAGFQVEHGEAGSSTPVDVQEQRGSIHLVEPIRESRTNPGGACAATHLSLRSTVPFDCFAIYIKADDLLLTHYLAGDYAHAFSGEPMPVGSGLSGWVVQSGRPLINGNPTVEPAYLEQTALLQQTGSALAIPLLNPLGDVFGVLTVYSRASAVYSKAHLRILQDLEPKLSLALLAAPEGQPRADQMVAIPETA